MRASTLLFGALACSCSETRPLPLRPPMDLPHDGGVRPNSSSAGEVRPGDGPRTGLPVEKEKTEAGRATPVRPPPQSVLYIGDSLVGFRGGLSRALAPRFFELGSKFVSDAWGGVGIQQFERSGRLGEWLKKAQPDFVIVSLGMNNIEAPRPESLAPAIRAIVQSIGPRRCLWLGPPNIKPDTGIVSVLRANVPPCAFVDSRGFSIERLDGVHPTDRGGEHWAEDLWPMLAGAW